ncbi:YncE family protein, partial [Bacillus cereus group sp. IBL03679]
NFGANAVSVIDIKQNIVITTIPVGLQPRGITITSDGKFVYVANFGSNNVSVIKVKDNVVVDTIVVEDSPIGIDVE